MPKEQKRRNENRNNYLRIFDAGMKGSIPNKSESFPKGTDQRICLSKPVSRPKVDTKSDRDEPEGVTKDKFSTTILLPLQQNIVRVLLGSRLPNSLGMLSVNVCKQTMKVENEGSKMRRKDEKGPELN
ncbi:hypothetical protein CEXT_370811 [Caerostris extrusa]|uniref:Uncharacterized protein n=1 Tax=Caerostris extrusa TaxID=172846 RepID=A0AAV4XF96_CAEEX|nr:hypothetical protein CEXT_370811 [Caerostris extrusa]